MVDLAALSMVKDIVTILGVVGGFTYYVMTVRATQRNQALSLKAQEQTLVTRQAQLFMNIYNQSFANVDFLENYRNIMTSQKDNFSEVAQRLFDYNNRSRENMELVNALTYIVSFYEGLGVFVKEGLIDIRLIALTMTNMTRSLWERLSPIVKEARKRTDFPRLLSEFEYLYVELMKYIIENPELKT